jgi:L-lactate dehydrogenase complex protein LldF
MSGQPPDVTPSGKPLHPDVVSDHDENPVKAGRRLEHAESASFALRAPPEPEPRGARVRGDRPINQSEAADRFIAAPAHEKFHDERLWDLRRKRDRQMHHIDEWEMLRELASGIKEHTLAHLDQYLEAFESNAQANGAHVHWARDGAEHNRIIHGVLRDHGVTSLIKSKSMLTDECGFRPYMASVGIEASGSSSSTTRTPAISSCPPSTSCAPTWPRCSPSTWARIRTTTTSIISPRCSGRRHGP